MVALRRTEPSPSSHGTIAHGTSVDVERNHGTAERNLDREELNRPAFGSVRNIQSVTGIKNARILSSGSGS